VVSTQTGGKQKLYVPLKSKECHVLVVLRTGVFLSAHTPRPFGVATEHKVARVGVPIARRATRVAHDGQRGGMGVAAFVEGFRRLGVGES